MTPTLATACAALPPRGAVPAWGGPALEALASEICTPCITHEFDLVWIGPVLRWGKVQLG
jgi:hypothetical protein